MSMNFNVFFSKLNDIMNKRRKRGEMGMRKGARRGRRGVGERKGGEGGEGGREGGGGAEGRRGGGGRRGGE